MAKRQYCNNCGEWGHFYKDCDRPTVSVGIILINDSYKCLMVCRKDSIGYVDYMKGYYSDISNILRTVTNDELLKISKSNPSISITDISGWSTPEWGWPKGRLSRTYESHLTCAMRELEEEVGINSTQYKILSTMPITEEFIGTNGKTYKHIFYLAQLTCEPTLLIQEKEISDAIWVTFENAKLLFRSYEVSKMVILSKAKSLLF